MGFFSGHLPWTQTDITQRTSRVIALRQSGTIVMSTSDSTKTAALTSIDTSLSEVTVLGVSGGSTLAPNLIYLTLTNSTTLTATRGDNSNAATIAYQVITRP